MNNTPNLFRIYFLNKRKRNNFKSISDQSKLLNKLKLIKVNNNFNVQ